MPAADLAKAMTALGGTQRVGNLLGPMIGAVLVFVFTIYLDSSLVAIRSIAPLVICVLHIAVFPCSEDRRNRARSLLPPAAAAGRVPSQVRERRTPLDVHWRSVVLLGITI